jgi:hypothetical protein
MESLTAARKDGLLREKYFSPSKLRELLIKPENFLSLSEGIKRELFRMGYPIGDFNTAFESLKNIMQKKA